MGEREKWKVNRHVWKKEKIFQHIGKEKRINNLFILMHIANLYGGRENEE